MRPGPFALLLFLSASSATEEGYETARNSEDHSSLLATHTELKTGLIWETALRPMNNILVKTITKLMSKGIITTVKDVGPSFIGLVLSEAAPPPRKDVPAPLYPVQTLNIPQTPVPKINFRFQKANRSAASSEKRRRRGGVIPNLTKLLRFQLVETLTQSLHRMIARPLSDGLCTSLEDSLSQPISAAIARGAGNVLIPQLSKQITEGVTKTVIPRLANSAFIVRKVSEALTRAVTQSVTQGVMSALTHDPISDYHCYYCREKEIYCQHCARDLSRTYTRNYYAQLYSAYYGQYYGREYGEYSRNFVIDYSMRMQDPES